MCSFLFSFYLIFKIRILHSTRIGIFTNIFTYIAAHRESNYDSSRLYFLAAHFCTWNFTENDKSTQNIYSMKYFILLLCNLSSMAKKVVVYMCEHDKFLLSSIYREIIVKFRFVFIMINDYICKLYMLKLKETSFVLCEIRKKKKQNRFVRG